MLALSRADAPEIRLLNRTRKRAEQVAAAFANRIAVRVLDWGDFRAAFADASLLINTTSLGMLGKGGLALPLAALPSTAGVADIVYNPLETPLLRDARARGHPVMDGLGMLLHQGAIAFAAWYGVAPAITAGLRQELETALRCA